MAHAGEEDAERHVTQQGWSGASAANGGALGWPVYDPARALARRVRMPSWEWGQRPCRNQHPSVVVVAGVVLAVGQGALAVLHRSMA
jgi:hypothetical protein